MSRPPAQPPRDAIAPDELEYYDLIVARRQAMRADRPDELAHDQDAGPYYGALANSPPFAAAIARLGYLVRTAGERDGTYSHQDREWVDQVLCADWKTNIVQLTHIPDALAVGVRLEAIRALRSGDEQTLTDEERFLAEYTRQVVGGRVTDEAYARLEERLGVRGAVEYTVFIAFLQFTIRLHQAFAHPDPGDAEIETMLDEFQAGTRELWDYRTRLR